MELLKEWLEDKEIRFEEGRTINKTPLFYIYHRNVEERKLIEEKLEGFEDLKVRALRINMYKVRFMVYHKNWEEM
jgi:hypothetical protein